MQAALFSCIALLIAVAPAIAETPAPAGARPAYNARPLSAPPNGAAIARRFWAPGLDDGFTPQGVAVAGPSLVVSTYGEAGCRVYRMSAQDGAVEKNFIAVPTCKHGGGIAALPDGRVLLIDTQALFLLQGGAVTATIELERSLTGSFGAVEGENVWLGSYDTANPGKLWRLPLSLLFDGGRLREADATKTLKIPTRAQGLAFVKGEPWLSLSGSAFGRLARIDAESGEEIESFSTPDGIEDIDADANGMIWAVSEAGAKKYRDWRMNFPLVFMIDPGKLK